MAPIKTIAAALAAAAAVFGLWWFTSMGSRQVMAIDAPKEISAQDARQGKELGVMRYVLHISLALAVLAGVIIYFSFFNL